MNRRVAVRFASRWVVAIVALLALAGGTRAPADEAVAGQCGSMNGAKVCTSYRTRSGKITEISLDVPVAAIENAPADAPMVWPPKADVNADFAPAVREQTGFTFASIYWEPHGHPPSVYLVPHFDFHFYFAPVEQVQTIDCKDTTKPAVLPAGYALPDVTIPQVGKLVGVCIPAMGMHSVPKSDLDLASQHWQGSMLVGYYKQKPVFLEPMIPRAFLLRKQSFSLAIPKIEGTAHVQYPRRFRGVYLPGSKMYRLTLLY